MYFRPSLFILTAWLLLGGFLLDSPGADPKTSVKSQVNSMRTVRFELLGLRESRMEKAGKTLLKIPGVKTLQLDKSARRVVLTFDIEQTSLKQIRDSLRRESFTPVL